MQKRLPHLVLLAEIVFICIVHAVKIMGINNPPVKTGSFKASYIKPVFSSKQYTLVQSR